MKYGLVLEGGGLRGLFVAGATDVLMENGISFDGAVGVSAGAVFGANYKSNQPGRSIRYNTRFCRDKRYFSAKSLLTTGDLFNADFCYREIPEKLDVFDCAAYEASPMEFYIVCTDVETGKPVYRRCGRMDENGLTWLRASASLPLVSKVVEVDGRKLLDGGISDSIPLRFMESAGFDRNVVVLTQPRDYRKKKNSMLPVIKIKARRYPKLVEAVAKRHEMYNAELEFVSAAEKDGRALVIAPEASLPAGRIERDPDKLLETYRLGRLAAMAKLPEIKAFLGIEDLPDPVK